MAYTVVFLGHDSVKRDRVVAYLQERMAKENIFRATLTPFTDNYQRACIKIKPVRLIKKKLYCGQHYGVCPVTARKIKATYLEFEDWIKFHNLVNRVLNRFRVNANVWSTPVETRGKFWIRKGLKARVKWDVDETYDYRGHHIGKWDAGSESQFTKEI